ncbi:2-methylisoborneol synthase [Kitasatospora sp. MMS16-BH015]|uniref:terpene synthase family protein n=1 Tax=Kitasatospora sp. MMS16-BH015 TaxID=2018025 RepID=UPI000CA38A99|nr:terpene synthase family protein [Kitasatospora sp. MMS16-BH015]AUG75169.1 2-methylisoborneol synthase [Kitasatospora sp. MMS16-BH015]
MSGDPDTVRELSVRAFRHLARLTPPGAPHPEAAEVEDRLTGWAVATGLYEPGRTEALARRRIGHLAGWCMPDAPTPVVRLTAQYLTWVFAFDDTVAEDQEQLERHAALDLPRVLETGTLPPGRCGALVLALAAVRRDIVDAGGTALLPRLAHGLRQYLASCASEGPWRAGGTPPTLARYLDDRAHTSGGHPLYLHLLAPGMPPLGEPLPSAAVGLAEQAFLIGALANDLLGFAVEARQGDPVNVITVLAHEFDLDLPEAHRAAGVLHAAQKHRFDTDHDRLLADVSLGDPQRAFVRAVGGWVAGSAAAIEPYLRHFLSLEPEPTPNQRSTP